MDISDVSGYKYRSRVGVISGLRKESQGKVNRQQQSDICQLLATLVMEVSFREFRRGSPLELLRLLFNSLYPRYQFSSIILQNFTSVVLFIDS